MPADRPRLEIERHGLQDSVGRVDEVTAFDVSRVAASADEDLPFACREVQQGNLWRDRRYLDVIVNSTARPSGRRCGQDMVGFSVLRVGPRQDGHLAAARRDTLQSRRPVGGGEHDRVVVQPRRAAHRPHRPGQRDRRAPRQRHSHQRVAAIDVRRRLTVGGCEQSSDVVAADERPRLEVVERPHQKLRLVVADVHDACAVRSDRDSGLSVPRYR